MHYFSLFLVLLYLTSGKCKRDESSVIPPGVKTRTVAENLHYPWEILWGPDNMIWMTERGGKISKLDPVTGNKQLLLEIGEVRASGEGGLLGMALHPQFQNYPWLFVAYNYEKPNEGYREKIVRYEYDGHTLLRPVVLFDNIRASGIHNGCRLLITPDLKLFFTTGDAANQSLPQNKDAVNGKLIRLNLDGTIPLDNPFPNNPLWSYGHRNAQGLVYANNIMYSSEHGASSDDEINIIEKGRNYGWPNVEGFCNETSERDFCNTNQVKEPIYTWTPTEAVCGLDFYNSDAIPEFKNSLLLCTLKGSKLIQLKLNNNRTSITSGAELFSGNFGRLRDLCVSPTGKIYVCTSNGNDKIIEISAR